MKYNWLSSSNVFLWHNGCIVKTINNLTNATCYFSRRQNGRKTKRLLADDAVLAADRRQANRPTSWQRHRKLTSWFIFGLFVYVHANVESVELLTVSRHLINKPMRARWCRCAWPIARICEGYSPLSGQHLHCGVIDLSSDSALHKDVARGIGYPHGPSVIGLQKHAAERILPGAEMLSEGTWDEGARELVVQRVLKLTKCCKLDSWIWWVYCLLTHDWSRRYRKSQTTYVYGLSISRAISLICASILNIWRLFSK